MPRSANPEIKAARIRESVAMLPSMSDMDFVPVPVACVSLGHVPRSSYYAGAAKGLYPKPKKTGLRRSAVNVGELRACLTRIAGGPIDP